MTKESWDSYGGSIPMNAPGIPKTSESARPAVEWYAAHVRAGREPLSAEHLRSRGYEVLLPRYLEHRQWSDRVKTIERPLFPGYVFFRMCNGVAGKVVTAPGVIRILGDGRGPVPLQDHEIAAIQRIVDAGVATEPWKYIATGQRVRIAVGPLRDVEGVVLRSKKRARLIVSIPLLQRSVAVEISFEWVDSPPVTLTHDRM